MDVNGIGIEYLGHSGFVIVCKEGKRIAIDPYNVSDKVDKVDYILITHSHYDHCSIKDIQKLSKDGTIIITPADAQSKITKVENVHMEVIEVGDEMQLGKVRVEAIAAYNVGKDFHPKSEGWLGYILKIDNLVIYHAGDSDLTPEMRRLSGYGKKGNFFVVILPVSGTYVMNPVEAVEAASLLNPSLAIPMHYGAGVVGTVEDAKEFFQGCKELNINAKIFEKI